MAVSLKHNKVSAIADNPAAVSAGEVVPSDWNAEHVLTQASARLLGRTSAGTGPTEEISIGAGLSLSGGVLTGTASTPPGGSYSSVQFNNGAGGFGGATYITIDDANSRLYAGINSASSIYSWFSGHDGLTVLTGASSGGWARGLIHRSQSTHGIWDGVGIYGTNDAMSSHWRVGFGTNWWDASSAVNGLTVSAAGNAALSTGGSPTATHSSYRTLEVGAFGTSLFGQYGANGLWLTSNCYFDGEWKYARTGPAWRLEFGQASDNLIIYRAPSGSANVAHAAVVLYTLDSAGRLVNGVTDSGTAVAHFQKNGASAYGKAVLVSCTGGTDGPQIWYRRDGVSEWGVGMVPNSNDWGGYYGGNHATFGTEVFRFTSGGNFVLNNGTAAIIKNTGLTNYTDGCLELRTGTGDAGVGFHNGGANASSLIYSRSSGLFEFRNNPISSYQSVKMQDLYMNGGLFITINGGANSYGAVTLRGEKNGYAGIGFQRNDGTYMGTIMYATDRTYFGFYDETLGQWPMYTSAWTSTSRTWVFQGHLYATGNVTAYSDARVKKNIKTLKGALDDVVKMRGVSYDRSDIESSGVGVIAQELQKIAPVLVHEGDKGELSVAYGNLAGYFIEAIKELAARVKYLEALVEG
jgi:hypothetical protein